MAVGGDGETLSWMMRCWEGLQQIIIGIGGRALNELLSTKKGKSLWYGNSTPIDNGGNHQSSRLPTQIYQDLRRRHDGFTGVGHRIMADNDVKRRPIKK
eukprot:scaffold11368_cov63-Skeletonema_menzelii.AAC.1